MRPARDTGRPGAGPAVGVRPLASGDGPALRGMLDRLSGEAIHKRFHTPYPSVPGWMLEHIMGHRDGASLVAVAGGEVVGHAMYAREGDKTAEAAVLVEDAWQSRGVGKLLLAELARGAAGRGVEAFTGVALGENRRVLALVDAVFDGAEYAVTDGLYDIRMPLKGLRSPARAERGFQPAA